MSILKTTSRWVFLLVIFLSLQPAALAMPGEGGAMSPVRAENQFRSEWRNQRYDQARNGTQEKQADQKPGEGSKYQDGGMSTTPQNQAKKSEEAKGKQKTENTDTDKFALNPVENYNQVSAVKGTNVGPYDTFLNRQQQFNNVMAATDFQGLLGGAPATNIAGGIGFFGSCGSCGAKACQGGECQQGADKSVEAASANAGKLSADKAPKAGTKGAASDGQAKQSAAASSAGEDAIECMINAFEGMTQNLINVGNEEAGSPCAANQLTKTYENAVWMVQRMYKNCFLPMAILFLLPGALMTNIKTFISFGFLHNANDEDAVSPFTGILRSVIAIFLIPMTQVVISYMVDVGNSLQVTCAPYVSIPTIILWCEEQVQIFSPDQQGKPIKNLPSVPMAPWRGKFAGMPVAGAVAEQVTGLDSALSELANECMHVLSMGMTIAYAFQLVMICYLLCLGPLAAAFFAWPAVGRDLFRKAFATWVDGVVILSLWKFWWNVVLICMTIHVQSEGMNPFDPFEVYYLVAFLCIIMFVPFNPFDFKPGEIVGHAMEKAQSVAAKVAQGGKGGGSGGGGGKGGGRPGPPGAG